MSLIPGKTNIKMKTFAICTLALLAVSMKLTRAEHHQHPEHHKKDPMGFFVRISY